MGLDAQELHTVCCRWQAFEFEWGWESFMKDKFVKLVGLVNGWYRLRTSVGITRLDVNARMLANRLAESMCVCLR